MLPPVARLQGGAANYSVLREVSPARDSCRSVARGRIRTVADSLVVGCVGTSDWPKSAEVTLTVTVRLKFRQVRDVGEPNMDVLNRIVVGVAMPEAQPWDAAGLDPATRIAVRRAFQLADSLRIPVHMMTVLAEPESGRFRSESDARRCAMTDKEGAERVLAALKAEYECLSVETKAEIVFGRAWFEILRAAEASRKTLTICGTRNSGTVSRLLFGSTGLKLLRHAPGPVWLVKPRTDDDAVLNVLAATDLSEVGEDVIGAGVTLGRALSVQLTVMHVVDSDVDRRIARTGASEEEIARWRAEARNDAEEQLHDQLAATGYRSLQKGVHTQLAEGVADACLLSAIEELHVDMLIMASAGRGGIPGMLFGNTAERLLPALPCSLLAVKPADFVCPVDVR